MEPPGRAASGLLLRLGSSWHFAEGALGEDWALSAAVAWPLTQELPTDLLRLFSSMDPWRARPTVAAFRRALVERPTTEELEGGLELEWNGGFRSGPRSVKSSVMKDGGV